MLLLTLNSVQISSLAFLMSLDKEKPLSSLSAYSSQTSTRQCIHHIFVKKSTPDS